MHPRHRVLGALALVPMLAGVARADVAFHGIEPESISTQLSHDWNGDGEADYALLYRKAANNKVLAFYFSSPEGLTFLEDYSGYPTGEETVMSTSLSIKDNGSLYLTTGNEAFGSHRSMQSLTLSFRQGVWVVTGYTHGEYSANEPSQALTCDVNLLTGEGLLQGKSFKSAARAVPFKQWNGSKHAPRECPTA